MRDQMKKIILLCTILILIFSLAGSCAADSKSWLSSEYQMPNALESEQVAVCGDTTVRLLYVIPSSSETLVELEIEDPGIGTGSNDETFFPLRPGVNLNLLGFSANNILGPAKVAQGKQKIVLDLPPLSEFDAPATIELKDLQKCNSSTGALTTITGPWQLSFTPNVRAEQLVSRNFNVDKQVEVGDVQILLLGGQISATETLVYYQVLDMKGVTGESLGQPTLEYANQVFRERSRYQVDDSLVLSFPSLPDDISQFTVTFPRMISLDGPGALFSIPVGDYLGKSLAKDGSIPIDQVIEVKGAQFRFTNLVVSDNCFSLCYQPADDTQNSRLLLAGPGPLPLSDLIEAMDDKGRLYAAIGASATFDKEEGFKLKEQRIDFQGNLDPEASTLDIKVNITGVIGEAFVFNVEIVE
jgi:hypothetical protein